MSILSFVGGLGNQALNSVGLPGFAGSNPMQNNTVYNPGNGGGTVGGIPVDAAGQYYGAPNGGSYTPAPSGGGGGGGGGGATTYQAPVDPYARWGGTANYNNLMNQFNTQKQNLLDSTNSTIESTGKDYGYSIEDTLHKLQLAQQGIDTQGTQNELAKRQGTQGVQGMVSRGLKQGGVLLAGKNATNSSAAQAMSRAYGDLGRRQLSNVNNQYGSQLKDLQVKQQEQDYQKSTGINRLRDSKGDMVNNIVNAARQSLGELQNAMSGASLGDRLNIQAEIDGVRQRATERLQQLDATLNSGEARIAPTSIDQRRSAALEAANLGQAPENAFDFTSEVPAQFQNTGPFSSGLPIFTMPRGSRRE